MKERKIKSNKQRILTKQTTELLSKLLNRGCITTVEYEQIIKQI